MSIADAHYGFLIRLRPCSCDINTPYKWQPSLSFWHFMMSSKQCFMLPYNHIHTFDVGVHPIDAFITLFGISTFRAPHPTSRLLSHGNWLEDTKLSLTYKGRRWYAPELAIAERVYFLKVFFVTCSIWYFKSTDCIFIKKNILVIWNMWRCYAPAENKRHINKNLQNLQTITMTS